MDTCQKLRKAVGKKCVMDNFEEVNKCVDVIILGKSNSEAIKEIKSLICQFEGIMNKSNAYAVMTMSIALLICLISIVYNLKEINTALILLVSAIVIVFNVINIGILKTDYKDAFILKALNFKLDELIEESKHIESENVFDKKKEIKSKKKSKNKGKK